MLKNYIVLAWRNIVKQKGLSLINVFGLSMGLACFTLIMLYTLNEWSFDRFHKNAPQIYRVYTQDIQDKSEWPFNPLPLGPEMKRRLPDVTDYVRFYEDDVKFVRASEKVSLDRINFSDPQLLRMFSFKLKAGNPETALNDPHSILVTESTARKLFGREDALGKIVEIKVDSAFVPFRVMAIAEDLPSNSDIEFDILGNVEYLLGTSWGKEKGNDWESEECQTYVLLKPGTTLPDNAGPLMAFRNSYYPDEDSATRNRLRFGFQPLLSMHTDTRITRNQVPPVSPETLWILLAIAGGVLLIACSNFTTLAIGRSASRAREVGIRKVIGGNRRSLAFQFFTDALAFTLVSAMVAFMMATLLLPYMNTLSGRNLEFSVARYPELPWIMGSVIVLTGLLSGAYPAFVLSNFRPVEVLKRKIKVGGSNLLTKSLVSIQFMIAAGLIVSTIIIMQQLRYLQTKSPGFQKENVVVVDATGTDADKIYPFFKQILSDNPAIAGLARADLGLGQGKGYSHSGFTYEGMHKETFEYSVDPNFLNVLGMQLIAGRNFDPAIASDSTLGIIVNQAMVKDFGWTLQTAVGQRLKGYNPKMVPVVIGVVGDFNYKSMSVEVASQMFMQFDRAPKDKFYVRLTPGDPSAALAAMESQWSKLAPGYPFQYSFLDQDLDAFYRSEQRWSSIVGWAGGISIFLSCLGLLGLATLAVSNRSKEISVRKVLGAPVTGLVNLLSVDFLRPVAFAILIASPIVWYLMNHWLQSYANRIDIKWWIFVLTGAGMVMLAFVTICFQTIKAAMSNPIKNLRIE